MSSDYKTIQIRRGLNSEFISANPILNSGEPAYVIDAKVFKIGDGITSWNNLSTIGSQGIAELSGILSSTIQAQISNLIDGAPNTLNTLNEIANAIGDNAGFVFRVDAIENIAEYASGVAEYASGVADLKINGSGTINYLSKWLNNNTIVDSIIYESGNNIGIGTNTPNYPLDVQGNSRFKQNLIVNGSGHFNSGIYIDGSPVIKSDITNISGSVSGVYNIVIIDQDTYDNILIKDSNTLYFIQ